MARYKYTQESGSNFKVNASDECDALETENEKRQILDDLGDLLGHTKFDDSYPADETAGGTLDYVKKNNFTSTGDPTSTGDDSIAGYAVGSRWINVTTDKEYVCLDSSSGAAVWEETTVDTFLDMTDTPADYSGDASKLLTVTTGEDAVEFISSTGFALDGFGTPTTGTSLNASTGRHGLLPRLGGGTSNYLRADGTWVTPPGAGDVYSSGAFTVGRLTEISTTGGVIKESPFAVTTGDVFDFRAHSAGFTEQAIATTTGTVAINWNNGNKALYTRSTGTVGGAATFTFTAPVKSMNLLLIVRGSTGGSTGAVTLPTVYWGNATYPTFSVGASAIDVVSFYYSTGLTDYLGLGSANFSTV